MRSCSGGTDGLSRSVVNVRLCPGRGWGATIPLYFVASMSEAPLLWSCDQLHAGGERVAGGGQRNTNVRGGGEGVVDFIIQHRGAGIGGRV